MDKSWFRKLFDRPRQRQLASIQSKADDGDAGAQFSLGFSFANRGKATQDYTQAAHWYLKAADQNHALAQLNLGRMFAGGQGVTQDEDKAVMWIQKAARQGDAGAQHDLGLRCLRARFDGLPQDALESNLEAYKWFRLAAAQDYMGSQAAFEALSLGMTREQVAEGNQRATTFSASSSNPVPA